jgi:uncharacterized protein
VGNIIVWADIPVEDLDRASKFYSHVLQIPVNRVPGMDGIALPGSPPAPGDTAPQAPVVAFDLYPGKPSLEGVTIYLTVSGDYASTLARVREAGGEVLEEPVDRGPMVGILAYIKDSEGNRIGLHQPSAGM